MCKREVVAVVLFGADGKLIAEGTQAITASGAEDIPWLNVNMPSRVAKSIQAEALGDGVTRITVDGREEYDLRGQFIVIERPDNSDLATVVDGDHEVGHVGPFDDFLRSLL